MNEITKAEIRKKLGNISQLRELLLGDQLAEYNQRLDSLETNLQQSQAAIAARLTQLEQKLLEQINSVASSGEQRSKYYYLKTQSEQQQLQEEIEHLSQSNQESIGSLHQSLNTEIAQSKSDLYQDITLFKKELSYKLENHLQELTTNKISHTDLAEVLLELSLKLKETNSSSDQANAKD